MIKPSTWQAGTVSAIHTSARLRWPGLVWEGRVHKPRAGSHSLPLHTGNLEPLGPELLLPALLGPCLAPGAMKQQVFWMGLEYTCRLLGITTAAGKTLPPSSGPLRTGHSTRGCPRGGRRPAGDGQKHLAASSPPAPKPRKHGSAGQWQTQWGEPGAGSRGYGTESLLGHPPSM